MDKTAKIRMKAKRNVTDLAGEKVMVDFEQGKYFCIKGVGNDIWDMLDGQEGEDGITVEAILHKLMEEYEVMEEVCEKEVLAFLDKKLWVDVLNAGADGIILKTGELLTKTDVQAVMDGKKLVFNYPILEKIVDRFKKSVANDAKRQEAVISYDIDEYDERFLRHLALGYTKEMIANLKGMPFGVKSLEKRQNDLIGRLFPNGERVGVNATRLAVRALELRIIDLDNLEPDEE